METSSEKSLSSNKIIGLPEIPFLVHTICLSNGSWSWWDKRARTSVFSTLRKIEYKRHKFTGHKADC